MRNPSIKVRVQVTDEDFKRWGGGFYSTLKSAIARRLPYLGKSRDLDGNVVHPCIAVYADHVLFYEAREGENRFRLPLSVHRNLAWRNGRRYKPFGFTLEVPAWTALGVEAPRVPKRGTVRVKVDVTAERIAYGIKRRLCPIHTAMRDAGIRGHRVIQYEDAKIRFTGKRRYEPAIPVPEYLKVWIKRFDNRRDSLTGRALPFAFHLDVPAARVGEASRTPGRTLVFPSRTASLNAVAL